MTAVNSACLRKLPRHDGCYNDWVMRWGWLAVVVATGCTGSVGATPTLRIEPPTIALDVDLARPAPAIDLHVWAGATDVTADATFALAGAPVGAITGGRLASDGATGGVAVITATVGELTATAVVTVNIHGVRLVAATPADAPAWFAAAPDVPVTEPLEPADGEVLPPDLGKLEIDFGADDADDVHELEITAPYLDVQVYALGVAGPRHLELLPAEWTAVAHTALGGLAQLVVRSTRSGGGAPAHALSAKLGIADLPALPLIFSGAPVDATGAATTQPALFCYAPATAAVEPFVASAAGGCVGCHVSISADGSRIAAAGSVDATGALAGMIVDTSARTIAASDAVLPWTTSAFDPSGALVTTYQNTGLLTIRDGATAVPITTIPEATLGEYASAPAISPGGGSLAYVVLTAPGDTFVGTALHVRPWHVATASVGPAIELATAAGIEAPQFSPDGKWLLYSRTSSIDSAVTQAIEAVRADGGAPPIDLTVDPLDGIPRWASPIASARAGGNAAEPMAWIAFSSGRPIGAQTLGSHQVELWLAAFYPERGAISVPFHLPGQSLALSALHAPVYCTACL